MKNPHNKGSAFERDVAKQLSLAVTNGSDAFIFARRSGSGGAGRDKSGASGITGDIFADKPEGNPLTDQVSIECKFYKDLTRGLWNYISGKPSKVDEFIAQAKEDGDVGKKSWMLIMKCNNMSVIVITDCPKVVSENAWKRDGIYLDSFANSLEALRVN